MNLQSFINGTFNEQQIEYKQVLDNKSELKSHTYNTDAKNLNCKCPITMSPFNNGDVITELPCGHLFNTDAIEEWVLENKASCPVCRHKLKNIKEIRITPEIVPEVINDDLSQPSRRLIRSIMDYIIGDSLNQIVNPIPVNPIPDNDLSINPLNITNNDTSNNVIPENDISYNDIQENDPVLNSINNYLSTINRIMDRRIQQEDNSIMQEAILASLREQ